MEENSIDAAQEKHIPVVEKVNGGVKVTVGSVVHPMEADHFIELIEVHADGTLYRQYLQPGDKPEAEFLTNTDTVEAWAYCNLHGLWKA